MAHSPRRAAVIPGPRCARARAPPLDRVAGAEGRSLPTACSQRLGEERRPPEPRGGAGTRRRRTAGVMAARRALWVAIFSVDAAALSYTIYTLCVCVCAVSVPFLSAPVRRRTAHGPFRNR